VIENLAAGTTVVLLPGLYQGACQVKLPSNLVLRGESQSDGKVVIDCNSTSVHFEIAESGCVHIEGVSLVNGKASRGDGGGCLLIQKGARVSLNDVLLENCSAPAEARLGAGIFVGEDGQLTVNNSRFSHMLAAGAGGAIYMSPDSSVDIISSNFQACTASNGGALYLDKASVIATNVLMTSNMATIGKGGAVHAEHGSTIIVRGSNIDDNFSPSDGAGIAIGQSSYLEVFDASISGNTANCNGGGIHAQERSTVILVGKVKIENNQATGVNKCKHPVLSYVVTGNGGGVCIDSQSSLTNVGPASISYNIAADSGGGICCSGSHLCVLSLSGAVLDQNHAQSGGGAFVKSGTLVATNVSISNNTAEWGAGISGYEGLIIGGMKILLAGHSTIHHNTAAYSGGGLLLSGRWTLTLKDSSSISFNVAGKTGGGIDIRKGLTSILLSDSAIVHQNAAGRDGGGIALDNGCGSSQSVCTSPPIFLNLKDDAAISGNTAQNRGGGVFALDLNIFIVLSGHSVISDNYAGTNGGGIALEKGPGLVSIENAVVSFNRASESGGGVYSGSGCSVSLSHAARFAGNQAENGGAIYGGPESSISVTNDVEINNNIAHSSGGGIFANEATVELCGNSTVSFNHAQEDGGGVVLHGASNFVARDSSMVSKNMADMGGGILAKDTSIVDVFDDVAIANNHARAEGGGLCLLSKSLFFTRHSSCVTISSNSAGLSGGGLSLHSFASATLDGTVRILGNQAHSEGGGCILHSYSSFVVTSSCLLSMQSNIAWRGAGGALVQKSFSTLEIVAISPVVLGNNSAGLRGGALALMATDSLLLSKSVKWLHVIMENNRAWGGDGGAVFTYRSILLLSAGSTILRGNLAGGLGGALTASDVDVIVEHGHVFEASQNLAYMHGGAVALVAGASMHVQGRLGGCNPFCEESQRGNGRCDPECLTFDCNWDLGECLYLLEAGASKASETCDRDKCSLVDQTFSECHADCFDASCDWSRYQCVVARDEIRMCPLLDAVAFRSMKLRREGMNASSLGLNFLQGGNSYEYGRCLGDCNQPSSPQLISTMLGPGKVGVTALHLNKNFGADWLHAALHTVSTIDGFTVEAWFKPTWANSNDYSGAKISMLIAGTNFALGMLWSPLTPSIMWPLAFAAVPSPSTTTCSPTANVMTDRTGSFGHRTVPRTGSGYCSWIIAPVGAEKISIIFTEFSIHLGRTDDKITKEASNGDLVTLWSCMNPSCTSKHPNSNKFTGGQMPWPWTSITGVVLVELQYYVGQKQTGPGFSAMFAAAYARLQLTTLRWHHVAVSVDATSLLRIHVNGTEIWNSSLNYNLTKDRPFGGQFGTAVGTGCPDWKPFWGSGRVLNEYQPQNSEYSGAIDSLRFWKYARTSEEISSSLNVGCAQSLLDSTMSTLASCYSFDVYNESENFFPDESGHGFHLYAAPPSSSNVPSPHLAWCVNMDDKGFDSVADDFYTIMPPSWWDQAPLKKMWGYCSAGDKPRLPGAGFKYNVADMVAAVLALSKIKDVSGLTAFTGCAQISLNMSYNSAQGHGGAIYYGSCQGLDAKCFVRGLGTRSGSNGMILHHNKALSGAGGAIFVECHELGSDCTEMLGDANTLGVLPSIHKVHFEDNSAAAYGNKVATQPLALVWYGVSPAGVEIVPSRVSQCTDEAARSSSRVFPQLVAAVQPLDSFGSVARGLEDVAQVRVYIYPD
jgi:predicted outer membrane repeat protein